MSKQKDTTAPLEAGEYYHIYNRGNDGQIIFPQQKNYSYFLKKYKEYTLNYCDTFCYALIPNHFHLLIRVKSEKELLAAAMKDFTKVHKNFFQHYVIKGGEADLLNFQNLVNLLHHQPQNYYNYFHLSDAATMRKHLLQWIMSERMRRFLLGYAKAIKKQEGRPGSLFQKLFRRKKIIGIEDTKQLVLYIHRNLIHHGYAIDLDDDGWTSYHSFYSAQKSSLNRAAVLEWFAGIDNFKVAHERYIDDWRHAQRWLLE